MFGFGFAKLAVLAVLLFLAWNAFKWFKRFNSVDKNDKIIESETCPKCGAYIAMNDDSPACDEAKCPYK